MRSSAAWIVGLALLGAPGPAVAETDGADAPISVVLLAPVSGGDAWQPDEPIVLEVSGLALERAAVAFDGVDVSSWVRAEGDRWHLDLPTAPEPGPHRIEVIEAVRGDLFVPRADLALEVRSTPRFEEFQGWGQASVEVLHRVEDHDLGETPDRTGSRGAARYEGRISGGGATPWSVDLYAPLLFDADGDRSELGRRFDPADYLLSADVGRVSGSLGQHMPEPSSLLLQGFDRRGLSFGLEGPLRTRFSGFIFRTDPVTGFRESFGFSDEDRRVLGGTFSTEPLAIGPAEEGIGEVTLSATYLDATGDETGTAVATDASGQSTERGQGYALVADTYFWQRRFRFRGEYAHSRFNFDGGGGAEPVNDDAWAWLVEAEVLRNADVLGQPMTVNLSLEERELGTFFRSLGNPGAPTDLRTVTAQGLLYWAGLSFQGSWTRSRDNRDDVDEQITYRDEDWLADLSYTPPWLAGYEETAWQRWLGTPTISLGWSRVRRKPVANDERTTSFFDPFSGMDLEVSALAINETMRTVYVNVGSSYPKWSWLAGYTKIRSDDATGATADSTSKLVSGDLTFQPGDRWSVTGRFQRESLGERGPDLDTTTYLVGGEVSVDVLPDRLDGTVRVDWTKVRDSERISDERRTTWTAYGNWHAIRAGERYPGLTLSVLGSWEDVEDFATPSLDRDAWQVFLKAELQWSGSH